MDYSQLKYDEKGLVCAIAQDYLSGEILMQAYMNEQAIKATIKTKFATYYSRSRASLWIKGETSGNKQRVISMSIDCDNDCILLQVEQIGSACHTGNRSCFYRNIDEGACYPDYKIVGEVARTIHERKVNPQEGSYTNYLFNKGVEKICKKIGEESTEAVIAAIKDDKAELVGELCDILYHSLVLMEAKGISLENIYHELMVREGKAPKSKYAIMDNDKERNRDKKTK